MKCDCCGAEIHGEPQYYRRVSSPCCSQACAASCKGTVPGLADIDITPGPEYLAASIRLFREQIDKSQALIAQAEEWQVVFDSDSYNSSHALRRWAELYCKDLGILEAALEALIDHEYQRIAYMKEGIQAAGGTP